VNAQTKIEPDGLAKLREPFPENQISWLPKETRAQIDARKAREQGCMVWNCPQCGGSHHKNAVHLQYVGHAALTDRLLDVDPHWSWEPMGFNPDGTPAFDKNGGLWIKLTVLGMTRPGYGCADGKTGGDAVKEIIGDALRNAAMRFGAALDLWHKGDLHAEDGAEPDAAGGQSKGARLAPGGTPDTPPEGKGKGWREPGSPFSTPTALHKAMTRLDHDLNGCGDSDMVYAVTATEDWREFVRVAEKHSPHYLHGGDPAPEEFEGLVAKAERLVREFDTAEANHVADLARA
jgi:hypothetical protein